ncbi:MAG: WbqC family protein [Candidatus Latescibacterota bacterium]
MPVMTPGPEQAARSGAPSRPQRLVAVHQPNYLPWLGFFDKAAKADVLVLLDHVQFPRRSWTSRVRVRGTQEAFWLSVPVRVKGRYDQTIGQTEIAYDEAWVERHLRTLRHCYGGSPHGDAVLEVLVPHYAARPALLAELNAILIRSLLDVLQIRTPVVLGSELGTQGRATHLLAALTQAAGGTGYLSGDGADGYQESQAYAARGLDLVYQRFAHPEYPQRGTPFVPGLSVVDALCCCGAERTRELLAASRQRWLADCRAAAGALPESALASTACRSPDARN